MAMALRRLLSSSSRSPTLLGACRRSPLPAAGGIYNHRSLPAIAQLQSQAGGESADKVALDPNNWVEFKLQETEKISHNTELFRFSFDPTARLGLIVASCLFTRVKVGEEYVVRPYTPISGPDTKGYFDLLVKLYPNGKMSQYFASLKPGDGVEVKGPLEKIKYIPNMKKKIGMVAGGTGITPMLQVVDAIINNPDDVTQVSLIFANVTPDDILLKEELDERSFSHPNFKVFYTVDKPDENWKGGTGFVSKNIVLKGLPGPGEDTLIFVCGPPGLMKHISGDKAPDRSQGEVSGLLKELGYTNEMVYKF